MSDEEGGIQFMGPEGPMTPEQYRAHVEMQKASNDAFWTDVRRMIFEELNGEQTYTLKHVFRLIGDSKRPQQWACYFEGLADAANHIIELGKAQTVPESDGLAEGETLWSHSFLLKDAGLCTKCGLPFATKPHQRWEMGLRGDGSDGDDI